MVANRMNSGKPQEEKPGATTEPAASAPVGSAGKMGAWLPLISALALAPVMAYAVTSFVLIPKLKSGPKVPSHAVPASESASVEAKSESKGEGKKEEGADVQQSVIMAKLLVNVSGTMGSRFLLTSITLMGNGGEFKSRCEKHDAQMRDMACSILSTKTIADLERPDARNLIRSELLINFNNILGGAAVQSIYFTEFAIQ